MRVVAYLGEDEADVLRAIASLSGAKPARVASEILHRELRDYAAANDKVARLATEARAFRRRRARSASVVTPLESWRTDRA